jgi:hypothetical protein
MLSRLLGEIGGFVNVGEAALHFFMKCPPIPCGCGAEVQDCSFWKNIPANRRVQEFGQEFFRARHVAKLALADHIHSSEVRNLIVSMRDLYQSIAENAGAKVVVDSSKNPAVPCLLSRVPGVRLSVIHLIRAPQGVADSWRRPKGYLSTAPAWRVSLKWALVNPFAEFIAWWQPAHHWTIRYEDLAENPRMFVESIAAAVLGRPADCSFLQGNRAAVRVQHILAGNPDKLERSDVVIEKRNPVLPRRTDFLVSLLTFPLMLRYGYIFQTAPWLAPIRFPFAYEFMGNRNALLAPERQIVSLPH